jgi:hypothetical protein
LAEVKISLLHPAANFHHDLLFSSSRGRNDDELAALSFQPRSAIWDMSPVIFEKMILFA